MTDDKLYTSLSANTIMAKLTQTITLYEISQRSWAQHVARVLSICCDVLRHAGCCWLKFEKGQIFHANLWICGLSGFVDVT